jgi:hypothetical protein
MKCLSPAVLSLLLAATLVPGLAQESAPKPPSGAAIEGIVTRDPDSQPVKKALLELIAENQTEAGNYTAVSGPDGVFRIENIVPGRYRLFAERVGLIDGGKRSGRGDGRLLTLTAGQELKDLHLRLVAAAVVHGRITDEDGDPMPNAQVSVLHQTYLAGHRHWEQLGADRANDLGEYRIANLAEGNVYVSVSPPPDFKSVIENAGGAESRSSKAVEKPAPAYQTTYYPGSTDRNQATPIQLRPGDDFPVNFSLTPAPSLSIRGSVVNLPARTSATVLLESRDFSLVLSGGQIHKDGSFTIPDVAPGSYTIMATVEGASVPMMARQALEVGSANVEGVRLAPQAGANVYGRLHLDNPALARSEGQSMVLMLDPAEGEDDPPSAIRETFSNLAQTAPDGSLQWRDVPSGSYYLRIADDPDADWFVKSIAAGGRDLEDSAISISGGSVALDIWLSANGARAEGTVLDGKEQPVSDAVVVLVPESRLRGRPDQYRQTLSDQSGHFRLRGIRPGDYTLFAWEKVDGQAYYNPDFLKTWQGQGVALHLSEREQKSLPVTVIPDPDPEP